MNQRVSATKSGYYLITIRSGMRGVLLKSNNERAFIISCLQDILSSRGILDDITPPAKLAVHIDLLAFSIQKEAIQLVAFSISEASVRSLVAVLASQLQQYQSDTCIPVVRGAHAANPVISLRMLAGPHDALAVCIQIHLNHTDWEFDRYSSIGFYLHDRRGDWVRLWRVSQLYENNTNNYRLLIKLALENEQASLKSEATTSLQYETSKRAL